LVAEHTPHAPLGWQAGVPPPHCASPVHPVHVPVDVVQTGVVPAQATLFVAEHWPQAPLD
jgi:hypothetical protein